MRNKKDYVACSLQKDIATDPMTVQELIDRLNLIKNKGMRVKVHEDGEPAYDLKIVDVQSNKDNPRIKELRLSSGVPMI